MVQHRVNAQVHLSREVPKESQNKLGIESLAIVGTFEDEDDGEDLGDCDTAEY